MLKRRTHPPPPLHRHRPEEPMMVRLRSKLEATSLPFCGNYVAFSSRPRSGWQPITAKRIAAEKTFGQRHTHTSHTHSCVSDRKQLPSLLPPLLSTPFHHSEAAAPHPSLLLFIVLFFISLVVATPFSVRHKRPPQSYFSTPFSYPGLVIHGVLNAFPSGL